MDGIRERARVGRMVYNQKGRVEKGKNGAKVRTLESESHQKNHTKFSKEF
jgi:hypothetical protein